MAHGQSFTVTATPEHVAGRWTFRYTLEHTKRTTRTDLTYNEAKHILAINCEDWRALLELAQMETK